MFNNNKGLKIAENNKFNIIETALAIMSVALIFWLGFWLISGQHISNAIDTATGFNIDRQLNSTFGKSRSIKHSFHANGNHMVYDAKSGMSNSARAINVPKD